MSLIGKLGPLARKYKTPIVIIWVLFLAISIPLAIDVRNNTEASEVIFLEDTESEYVQEYIEEYFEQFAADEVLLVIIRKNPDKDIVNDEQLKTSVSDFSQNKNLPENVTVNSIYSTESEMQYQYFLITEDIKNASNDMIYNLAEQIYQLKVLGNELYENISLVKNSTHTLYNDLNAIKELNQGLMEVSYVYTTFYWNISRIIYYIANQTNAYSSILTQNDLEILSNWLFDYDHLNSSLIIDVFNETSGVGNDIFPMLSTTGRQVLYSLAYNMTNQAFIDYLGANYTGSIIQSFLGVFNQTFDTFANEAGLSDILDYQSPSVLLAQISQGIVIDNLLNIHSQAFNATKETMFTIFNQQNLTDIALLFQLLNNTSIELTPEEQEGIIYNMLVLGGAPPDMVEMFSPLIPLIVHSYKNLASLLTGLEALPAYSVEETYPIYLTFLLNELNRSIDTILSQSGLSTYYISILPPLNTFLNFSAIIADLYFEVNITEVISEINEQISTLMIANFPPPSLVNNTFPEGIKRSFISDDERAMLIMFESAEGWNEKSLEELKIEIDSTLDPLSEDYEWYVTGGEAIPIEMQELINEDIEKIDIVTIVLVLSLLLIVFLSVIAPLVPVITIGIALICGHTVLWIFSQTSDVPAIMVSVMTVVAFGAGVDYVIFILNRYKEERQNGRGVDESIDIAIHHSGESVTASGMTVCVGFGSLILSSFMFLRFMGLGPLISIVFSLLVALTAIPAISSLIGDNIFWPRMFDEKTTSPKQLEKIRRIFSWVPSLEEIGRFIVRHPKKIILILLLLSTPFLTQAVMVEPDYDVKNNLPSGAESSIGFEKVSIHFTEGRVTPLQILVIFEDSFSNGTFYDQGAFDTIEAIANSIEEFDFINSIETVTRPLGDPINYERPLDPLNETLMLNYIGDNNKSALLNVLFSLPPMSNEGLGYLDDLRINLNEEAKFYPDVSEIMLGGAPSSYKEMADILEEEQPLMILFVLIGIFIVLLILLRSIFTPIRLELTILLSVFITLGAARFVFVEVLDQAIPWIVPIMLFVVLFGLGMDYDIFLVTRMKEEVRNGKTDEEAIVIALSKTGSIIMTCGIIMSFALGTLMISSNLILRVIGFSFFFAILLDAFVIRIFLVPAIMMIFGKWNWWLPFVKSSTKDDLT
ncbi:MAG: MMPL family transporter [Promethearchaeota archaeon]